MYIYRKIRRKKIIETYQKRTKLVDVSTNSNLYKSVVSTHSRTVEMRNFLISKKNSEGQEKLGDI